jgi:hypothetical protein
MGETGSEAPAKPEKLQSPPMLVEKTQRLIAALNAELNEPVIAYWNSFSGSICANDVLALYGVLKNLGPVDRLSLFIKSGGGDGESSLRMVNLLRQFTKHLTVLVPLECASAATMLALGAERVLMGPLACLSAVDTSLRHDLSPVDKDNSRVSVSQDELQRVIRLWQSQAGTESTNPYGSLFNFVHPLVVGAVDRASALSTRLCADILSYHMQDAEAAAKISERLNADYPSHSYPITLREAQKLGLNADCLPERLNQILLELNETYSEMGQRISIYFDAQNSHDNSILNIIESAGLQVFFQNDKDWFYRNEERRWITLNDKSGWRKAEYADGEVRVSTFHVR